MNGVYSPGMLQVTLSNHLPTFSLITQDTAHQPSFPLSEISVTCLLWFCGNSLTVLSSWPLDEPVYSSSHSKADKLLRATIEKGNSQCFLFAFVGWLCCVWTWSGMHQALPPVFFFSPVLTSQNHFVTFSKQNTVVSLLSYWRKERYSGILRQCWQLFQSCARGRTKAVPALESFQTLLNVSFWSCPKRSWTDSDFQVFSSSPGISVLKLGSPKFLLGIPTFIALIVRCFDFAMLWAMAEGIYILKPEWAMPAEIG